MKTKINKALFLSIFLMLPVPIFTSQIEELNNKRNSPNHLTNLSDNTTLKLNPKKDRTELIITNIGLNSEIIRKNYDQRLILEIEPESKINLSSEFQSISLPEYGVKTATLRKIDNKIKLEFLAQNNLNIENLNIEKKAKDILILIPEVGNVSETNKNLFKKPFKSVENKNNPPKERATAPPLGDIAVGTNYIPNPNLIEIEGPEITIVFRKTPAKEALEYLISKTSYDYVWVNADPSFKAGINTSASKIDDPRLISLNIKNLEFAKAFNAILMASGLQAKLEGRIVYIGPNVRDTIFSKRISKIYRLNQTSANSAASYLANLGAKVTKISTISTAITQGASQSETVSGASSASTTTQSTTTSVEVYGSDIGPLVGLIATTDDRLETITLIGPTKLVFVAEEFLKKLDLRQRQVALTVRILDVNISDGKTLDNSWAMRQNNNFIVNDNGKLLAAFGKNLPPDESGDFASSATAAIKANPGMDYLNDTFLNFLRAQIESKNTKILASPTLILNEFPGQLGGESVSFSDISNSLKSGTIGRSYGNEAFVVVGTQVPINCTASEDSTVPSFDYGIRGLTFGARILKIDDNGFVTFAISPAITAASEQRNITNCGTIDLLATRRLDSGTIRVRDGNTLIMTGVLNTTDKETVKKFPILGDIPLIGQLFRNTASSKETNELVIMVTPQILKGSDQTFQNNENIYEPNTNEISSILKVKE
tara:strand:- start:1421 stop:3562 length:2142 start_codon:yes stop_codon:yes gene_type:complete